jgi:hypothetical protein
MTKNSIVCSISANDKHTIALLSIRLHLLIYDCVFRSRNALLKINPDASIIAAIIGTTGGWSMVINATMIATAVIMNTVTIGFLSNHVGSGVIPLHNALINVLER